jgi:hypothetical protein
MARRSAHLLPLVRPDIVFADDVTPEDKAGRMKASAV